MGTKTLNDIFYKPDIGASGAVEKGKFDDGLDVADGLIEGNKDAKHTQGTDQGLDTGGGNAVVVVDIKDAVTKKHSQNTDTDLDATFEATFAKKADKLSVMAATSSAELAGIISDETGTGKAVFGTLPTINKINLSEGNIIFPATQVASAGGNTLDDYKEGNFVGGFAFGGGVTGISYFANLSKYTKIGRVVIVSGYIRIMNKGSDVGNATITGLPFTVANHDGFQSPVTLRLITGITFANQFQGYAVKTTNTIRLKEVTEGGVETDLMDTNFANASRISFQCTYFTD